MDGPTIEHFTSDALKNPQRWYRELVEYSLGLICIHDLAGTILLINPAAAASLGYRPVDGVGRNLRDFLPTSKRELFGEYLQRIARAGQDAGLMNIVARSGDVRIWMYHNVLTHDSDGTACVLGHAIDVTDRIEAERTLKESQKALYAAQAALEIRVRERTLELESVNDQLRIEVAEREAAVNAREQALVAQRDTLIFLSDFSDRLAPVVTYERLLDEVQHLPVPFLADWTSIVPVAHDSTHGDDLSRPSALRQAIASGEPVAVSETDYESMRELFQSFGAGAPSHSIQSVAFVPLAVDRKTKAVLCLFGAAPDRFSGPRALVLDHVTRRIRLALDRIELYRAAYDANRHKDEFLKTLSHELRTPLNAIYGWARMLRTRSLDEQTDHAVEVIERNAEAQIRLIDEVLDVSRIITGKMTLATSACEVAALLRATLDALRPACDERQLRLDVRIDPEPALVVADPHRLQQVFSNLLSNAVKFTAPGGTIRVALRSVDGWVECDIADDGIGIPPDVLPFIFDRFRQSDISITRQHGGLGLGLAIVKDIIELHNGTVEATSLGAGLGATFRVRLPAIASAAVSTSGQVLSP